MSPSHAESMAPVLAERREAIRLKRRQAVLARAREEARADLLVRLEYGLRPLDLITADPTPRPTT